MSAMRKIGEYLGLLEDTGRYDDEYDDYDNQAADARYDTGARTEEQALVPASRRRLRSADVADISERRRPAAPPTSSCPGSPRCTRAPTTRPG